MHNSSIYKTKVDSLFLISTHLYYRLYFHYCEHILTFTQFYITRHIVWISQLHLCVFFLLLPWMGSLLLHVQLTFSSLNEKLLTELLELFQQFVMNNDCLPARKPRKWLKRSNLMSLLCLVNHT